MDELCSACLCDGRNLYLIENTAFYHLYLQILNEIQVYDAAMCIRVCWECRALLQRFQQFKTQVRQSYAELLHHIQQNTPKFSLRKPSRLTVHSTVSISWPQPGGDVKLEQEVPGDEVKIKTEVEEHCEPESFVNGLEIDLKYEGEKISKKKTKKKLKSNKKKKKLKQPIENTSDGFSDREAYEQDELENTKLDNHIQDVENAGTEESTYICSRCGLPFKNKGSFDAHVKSEHSKVVLSKPESNLPRPRSKEVLAEKPECTECGKVFSSRKTYRYHLNVLHKGQNRYPCPRCGKVYQWKSNLGRHLRTHKRPQSCALPDESVRRLSEAKPSISTSPAIAIAAEARDDGELYCELCDKPFASVATYRQHLRVSRRHVSESEFSFVCGECGKKFVNKTRLRDHVDWEHLKKIKFRCQLCNKPFKCHTSLYVHMQNVHRNKEKKDNLCHVCGKSYQNAAKLKYHIVAMHTTETPYQCGQCAAAFGWYSSLYRHIREVHYKMKVQPKKSKKCKKLPEEPPPMPLAAP